MKNSINNRFISLFTVFSLILMTVFNTPGFSMIASALSNNIWNGTESAVPTKGSGSESDPYIIETPAELYYVVFVAENDTKNKYYQLANDIYLNDTSNPDWENDSPKVWESKTNKLNDTSFRGNFDGNGYVVHGIYTDYTGKSGWYKAALFPKVEAGDSDISIKNVGVEDSAISGNQATAAIVGQISGSDSTTVTVTGCYADESVKVNGTVDVGGLVGLVDFTGNFKLGNCYSSVKLTYDGTGTKNTLGSLVGMFDQDATSRSVSNCYVIINTKDFDKGFNAIPTGTTATDNVTYTNVHAGNEENNVEKIQRGSAQQAVIIRRWGSDFKGFEVKKKIPLFDYTDTWYADLNGGYLSLKIFNKSQLSGTYDNSKFGGEGTEESPYIIDTDEKLAILRCVSPELTEGKVYKLSNDISVNNQGDEKWQATSIFLGTFDGDGHIIKGLNIDGSQHSFAALFNALGDGAVVANVGIETSYIEGVNSSAIAGDVFGNNVSIRNCYAGDGVRINGSTTVGGIIGQVRGKYFTMTNCFFTGTFIGNAEQEAGLAGKLEVEENYLKTVTFSNCYAATSDNNLAMPSSLNINKIRCLNLYGTVEQPSVDTSSSNVIFKIVSKENMTGNSAAVNMTLLDFYSTWIAKEGTTPRLRIFTGDIDRNSGTAGAIWSGRTATDYASGKGTKEDPYIIETAEQLALLVRTSVYDPQQTADKYYKLANNIFLNDTSADEWYTSETANEWFVDFGYDSIGFQGNFNGNGYSVYGICYKNTESNKSHGLFPALGGSAVVENVAVSNFYSPDSTHWAGAIAGFISLFANTEKPIEIRSCVSASSNRVGGHCAGGILGHDCKPIVLSDCLSAASVEPLQSRGTLIGIIDSFQKTTITNCLSLNTVKTISFWSSSYPFPDVTNVYSTKSSINVSGISIGSITGEKAKATLKGFDFENTWTAVEGATPVPKVFINHGSDEAYCGIWNGDMADSFAGGDGTESNPYIIKTGGQLYKAIYAGKVNGKNVTSQKYYRLENDIYLNDVSDTNWYTKAGLNEWVRYDADKEIGSFRGTLDGNGYTVYGIYYSKESYLQYTGLIPHASEWGDGEYTVTVKNIGIKDSYINGINAGAIVGIASGNNNNKVLVSGCYADESVILNGINAEGSRGSSGLAAMVDNPNFTMEDCFSRVKRVGYTKSDEARGSLIGLVNVDISTSFDNANRVLVKNCYAVITKEDYDRGFSVVPENWAGLNVHYVNVHGGITPDGSNVENGYKANHKGINYSEETVLSHWPSDFRKTALLSGFDSNVWLPGDGDQSYMLQKIFNKQGYSLKSDKVKITFNLLDGTVKELVGYPGNTISWSEIQNNDLVDWYLESKCLTKFEYDVFPDYDITLYAKLKISVWNGQSSSGFGGGDGSEDYPYIIKDGSQLYYMLTSFDTSGKFFRITEDIYLNDITDSNWRNNPKRWISSNGSSNVFKGTLDGEGHTVYGVYCDSTSAEYAGLIPVLSAASGNVSVTNLKLNDSYIRGKNVGGLIGKISSSSCSVTVSACYVGKNVEISGSSSQGGIIGQLENSDDTIKNCAFVGTISGSNLGKEKQGGLIGYSLVSPDNAKNVKIQNSFAVTGNNIPVSSATASGVNAVFTNVYGNHVDGYGLSGITQVAENDMMNSVAQKYMPELEFNTVWQIGVNSYPELILFESGKKGDVNKDSKIDIVDLVRYKKITAGSVNADIKDADLNNDSRIDSSELTLTKKYLLDLYQPETKVNEEITSFKTGKKYKLVWNDEFDGDSIDYNKWGYGYGNSSFSKYLSLKTQEDDSSVIGVRNGQLQLNGKRYFDPVDNNVKYASSISLETQGTMNFKYGYLEMRAKVPLRKGGFPALWATGTPGLVSKKSNDYYVEIDVFESLGARKIESNFHKWYTSLGGVSTVIDLNRPGIVSGNTIYTQLWLNPEQRRVLPYEYHTYSMEWTPEYLKTYFDDTEICSIDLTVTYDANWDEPNGVGAGSGIKIPQEYRNMDGFHDYIGLLIQNIVIGIDEGGWDDDIRVTDDTKFDFEYYIDYIRLYQDPNVNESGLVYLNENGEKVDYYKNSK